MRRRHFITLIGGAAAAWPLAARGQVSRKRPLIGRLSFASRDTPLLVRYINGFLSGMRELGYVDGRDFDITYAMADFHRDQLPRVAAELVNLAPDVIVAGATLEAVAAAKATATIPIVVAVVADPIALGFTTSDARPTGNMTGIMPYVKGLPAKQLELARELVPGATRIGLLDDVIDPKAQNGQGSWHHCAIVSARSGRRCDRMKRREFIGLISAVAVMLPFPAYPQRSAKTYRIGYLNGGKEAAFREYLAAFKTGMRDLGYVEGQDFSIEARFADGNFEHLPSLVSELLSHDPDVLFVATTPANLAAKAATSTVPIVLVAVADPIGVGLISNLAHPGGNITGVTNIGAELAGKRLEILKEIVPAASKVAILINPNDPNARLQMDSAKKRAALVPSAGT